METVMLEEGVKTYRSSNGPMPEPNSTPMIEHPPATDKQVLEAALAGCTVALERSARLYPYMAYDERGQYISRYASEREAWHAAWLVVQHHMKFPGETRTTFIEGVD